MINEKLEYRQENKKLFFKGSLVAIIIALTPLYFQIYKSVPKSKVWDTFLFTYESIYYRDANVAFWILTGKVVPLFLLTIWFFTCRHWWYHALLVPICLYIYQGMGVFNDDILYFDEVNFLHLVPVMIVIIPSIYLVRARIFNHLNTVDKTTQDLEDELTFKPKTFWGKVKQYF
ncbi:hypothetical protein [Olleya namhaensis]|uniref:hypothetical protein n=1 Tax=Olleya namhaensis TaxID=1144750 RepID=UPI001FE05EA6|nr:hypothetical protein [Olleya namhaensis]